MCGDNATQPVRSTNLLLRNNIRQRMDGTPEMRFQGLAQVPPVSRWIPPRRLAIPSNLYTPGLDGVTLARRRLPRSRHGSPAMGNTGSGRRDGRGVPVARTLTRKTLETTAMFRRTGSTHPCGLNEAVPRATPRDAYISCISWRRASTVRVGPGGLPPDPAFHIVHIDDVRSLPGLAGVHTRREGTPRSPQRGGRGLVEPIRKNDCT